MAAPDVKQLFQGVDKGSFAYRMLNKLGWSEGRGLGANQQGITEHVRVKKKSDALGVGAAERAHSQRDWTTGMVGFDSVLASLKEVKAARDGDASDGSGSGSGSDSGGEAAAAAATAKRKAKKAKKEKAGKKEKKKKKDKAGKKARKQQESSGGGDSSGSDGEAVPAPAAAPAPAPAPAGGRVRAASHIGRYAKRERAKRVSNYSANDLAAILGSAFSHQPAEVTANGGGGGGASSSGGGSGGDGSDSDAAAVGDDALPRPGTPAKAEQPPAAAAPDAPAAEAPARAWWGAMFTRAGRSGARARAAKGMATKARGFSEQDQTDLFMKTHDGATTARQGLGRAGAPKKVAGARWQGTKTRLGSDSGSEGSGSEGGEEEQEQEEEGGGDGALAAAGIVIVGPKRQQREQAQQQEQQQESKPSKKAKRSSKQDQQQEQEQQQQQQQAGKKRKGKGASPPASKKQKQQDQQQRQCEQGAPKVKWAKVAAKLLQSAPKRRMRVAQLHAQALAEAGLAPGSVAPAEADAAVQRMLRKLRKAGSFAVCDKYVRLS